MASFSRGIIGRLSLRAIFPLASLVFLFFFSWQTTAHAGVLKRATDLLSTSAPSATSSHSLSFMASTTIPAGGKIVIVPEAVGVSAFNIPVGLDFNDLDMSVAVATTGPFIDRTLAAAPSATEEGVSVVSGTSGSITITLGSGGSSAIAAGEVVRFEIGSTAVVGGAGDDDITNPGAPGSYHIRLDTSDAGNAPLDYGSTVVVVVLPVSFGPVDTTDSVPPLRTNGLPGGLLPGGTLNVFVSFNTDKVAVCRYATSSGVDYFSMNPLDTFTDVNGGLLHYRSFPVVDNTIYNFYIRCRKFTNNPNPDDYLISFEIGVPPGTATPPPPPTPTGGSGQSGGGGGGGGLMLQNGEVTIEGKAAPFSTIVYLKDGVIAREQPVSVLGGFSEKFTDLPRGTYAWGVYVRDEKGVRSSVYTSTIYLVARTNNIIAPVYISPTMRAATTTVPLGEPVVLTGYAIALNTVEVIMNRQGNALSGSIVTATTTANGNGSWSVTLPSDGLSQGTYEIKAHTLISEKDQSLFSPILYVGIGENPNVDLSNRSDLNKDQKVNLIDFSILLFNWRGSDPVSDINQDGTVNLTDFSIMLANWTG